MKNKIAKITAFAFTALLGIGAFASISSSKVSKATAGPIPVSTFDSYFNGWDGVTKGVETRGFYATAPEDSGKAWLYNNIWNDLSKRSAVDIEFAVDYYDDPLNQHASNNSDALDFYIYANNSGNPGSLITMLRIWTGAGGVTNGNHSCQFVEADSGWTSHEGNGWIVGDANTNSSFKVRISKTDGVQFYSTADWTYQSSTDSSYNASVISKLASAQELYFSFQGDGGFKADTKILIKTLNDRSYANDGTNFTQSNPTLYCGMDSKTVKVNEKFTLPALTGNDFKHNKAHHIGYKIGETVIADAWDEDLASFDKTFIKPGNYTITAFAVDWDENYTSHDIAVTVQDDDTPLAFHNWILDDTNFTDMTCNEKYTAAKTRLLKMSPEDIATYQTTGDYATSRARYEAWCAANYDDNPYGGEVVTGSTGLGNIMNANSNIMITAIVVGVALGCVALSLVIYKKKKHN